MLFDNDEEGKHCLDLMKRFNEKSKVWAEGKRVFSYRMVLNSSDHQFGYEAEDLWPEHLHASFLAKVNESEYLAEKTKRPKPLGGFHYGYTTQAKGPFSNHVIKNAEPSDCDAWVRLLELVRGGLEN